MLVKKYRLAKDQDVKKVLSRGKSFFSPIFRFKYLANQLDICRLTVVASAKFSKKATIRNRLKRQVREIFRLKFNKIKPGYDLVVYLKTPALEKTQPQLAKELLANLSKMKLLK